MKRNFDEYEGSSNNEITTNNVDTQNSVDIDANLELRQQLDKIIAETTMGEYRNNLMPLIDVINKRIEIKAYVLNISRMPQMTDTERKDAKRYIDDQKKILYSLLDDYVLKTNLIFTLDEAILDGGDDLPYYAILQNRFDVLKFLFEQRNYSPLICTPDSDSQEEGSENAYSYLHYAAQHSSLNIVKYLVEHHHLDECDTAQYLAICFAAQNCNPEIVKYFIHGLNVNYETSNDIGQGLLYNAFSMLPKSIETFKYLVTNHKFYYHQLIDENGFIPCIDFKEESYQLILKQVFNAIYNHSIKDDDCKNLNCLVAYLVKDAKTQNMLEPVQETIAKIYQSSPLYFSSENDDTKLNNLVEEALSYSGIDLVGNNHQDINYFDVYRLF